MKLKGKRELIVNGNLYKVILVVALPLMVSELVQRAYTLTDMYFMGRLGSIQVAALTFVDPLINVILSVGLGLSVPMLAMVSQSIGAKNYDKAKESIGNLICLALILSLIIGVVGFSSSGKILSLLKIEGELLTTSTAYLKIVLFGTLFTFLNVCYTSIKQAEGDTMRPLYMNIASLMCNVILNPIFIFKMGLGIQGAAIATVISKFLLSAYGMYDLFHKGSGLKINKSHIRITKGQFINILILGLPAIITKCTTPSGHMVINTYAVKYGTHVLAAFGLGNKINSIFFSLSTSLSTTMTTVVGQNLGAGNIERVKSAVKKVTIMSLITGGIGTFIIIFFSEEILANFTSDPQVVKTAVEFFRVVTPTVLTWGIFQIVMGVYQGAGYTKISMLISMIRLWVMRIPLIIILDRFIGEKSLWYSMAVSNYTIGLICIAFYLSNTWQKKNKYINV